MTTIKVADCARCNASVFRGYRLSRRRMALPIYCSATCEKLGKKERAIVARATYFWTKVARSDEKSCWPWMGYRDPQKYGRYGRLLAHRISYLITRGNIPAGQFVCHSCDNPVCVNPSHLWLGTAQDNVADMDAKKRRVAKSPRGEQSRKAKLSASQALEAFRSTESATAVGRRFGVTAQSIVLIRKGVNWAHVTGAGHAE